MKRKAAAANGKLSEKGGRKGASKSEVKRRKTGPRLPNALRRELGLGNSIPRGSDEEAGSEGEAAAQDVYEYEEGVAQEESKKNRRFDEVENLEYELPEDFEDEDVASSDDDSGEQSDEGENDSGRHARMLHSITGLPSEAFQARRKAPTVVDTQEISGSGAKISIHDLLDPLHGKSGYSELRKRVQQIERKPMTLAPPLPTVERDKIERQVTYTNARKNITKWESLIKRNREATTIYFEKDLDLGYNSVTAIASKFNPRTEFEKKMAELVNDPVIVDSHQNDGAKLLELNEVSIEDVKERQNRLAKMRSLLFRHDVKAKRIKKIKSKAYHRMLKKDRSKATTDDATMDPEAVKEQALKQEFKRAEERMTLKHKNKSKWAKRNLQRGLKAQDEGTRAAMAEQLRQHELLTRKMNSLNDSSSDDSSTEDEDDLQNGAEDAAKHLLKAKEKTLRIMEDDEEIPISGVLSLPFMKRGMQKRKEAADQEALDIIIEYDLSLEKADGLNGKASKQVEKTSGRKIFGVPKNPSHELNNHAKPREVDDGSDSEEEFGRGGNKNESRRENCDTGEPEREEPGLLIKGTDNRLQHLKGFEESTENQTAKSTHEVAIFASGSWRKMKGDKDTDSRNKPNGRVDALTLQTQDVKDPGVDSNDESDHEMVDGFLSSEMNGEYELPSQDDLIRRAFAGDDVDVEFEKDKTEILNEENPEPEKPVMLPGWGQWTSVQKKKGLPAWIVKEHEDAKQKREESIKKRKDAHLKHVIISEKIDKKTDKLLTKTLPFPFTSKEVFEHSIRMPIGPDFNPAISVGALNRPPVVKEPGTIIDPIKYVEVDPHEKLNSSDEKEHRTKKKSKRKHGAGKVKGK